MPDANTALQDACTTKIACLGERELLIVTAQSVAGLAGKDAATLLSEACTSRIACLTNRELRVVIAQALSDLVDA